MLSRSNPVKGVIGEKSIQSEICSYDINVRFCYALQLMGIGGEHAVTLSSFLDLPGAQKWNRQMSLLENFTNPIIEEVKKYAQQKGTEEEIIATINEIDNPVEQNLLETETPIHRVQASYDMGWQVRSSGNK
jgi:hypothetical protein